MMQMDWHYPAQNLVPFHLEEAMERSQFGLPGFMLSAAIGFATLASMAIGIVTPAPAREAPPLPIHQQPADECAVAELACGYYFDTVTIGDLRAAITPRR
jgi:hypothetical protein